MIKVVTLNFAPVYVLSQDCLYEKEDTKINYFAILIIYVLGTFFFLVTGTLQEGLFGHPVVF